jgi:hypothetical protein
LGLLALPAAMFAGTVTLNDGLETVVTTGDNISLGTCTTSCTLSGTANISSFLINWSFTSPGGIPAFGGPTNYSLSGGTGTFLVNDIPSSGSDSVSGTISLTSASTSGVNMTINGTLTATSLVTGGAAPTTAAFLAILAQVGITPPVPPNKTDNLVINIVNCNVATTPTACLTTNNVASIEAVGTTGTVASLGITGTAAVPEPTTMVLMGAGLVGLLVARRRVPKA